MATILVLDDDDMILETLSIILKDAGHDILTGSNGNEGLKRCRERKVDLVITDIVMPDKEGLETIQDIKKLYPEIKIIAMSGGGNIATSNYLQIAKAFGAQQTLEKPFKKKDIVSTVQEVLREH
ncbi:MAG: response regulator [Pseudomonadota bacterium]